jgi:hypothetical protein
MGESEQTIPAKRSPAKTTNHRRMSNSGALEFAAILAECGQNPARAIGQVGDGFHRNSWIERTVPGGSDNTSGAAAGQWCTEQL